MDHIASGVVSIEGGARLMRDRTRADTTGCANTLPADRSAPCGTITHKADYVWVMLNDADPGRTKA